MKRLPDCRWLLELADAEFRSWLEGELSTVLRTGTGRSPTFVASGESAEIVVASPPGRAAAAGDGSPGSDEPLGVDDYALATIGTGDGEHVLVTGGSDRAAAYGAFDLLERVGFRFLVSGDVPPEQPVAPLPPLQETVRCANSIRAVWISHCVTTTSMLSLPDYEALFDQMVKMRLNRLIFYHFDCDPYVDYSFRGERKLVGDIADPESGYISYGRFHGSYRVADIEIGAANFGNRVRVAPDALQQVSSSAEALDAAKELMRRIMREGKRRGIDVWMHILPQFIAPNLSKYTREMPRRHPHWSYWVSCTDPAAREVNRERVRGLLDSYPDLAGLSLGIPEGFFDDPYPESQQLIERRFPEYGEALQLQQEYWGEFWKGRELQEAHIRADIAFTEILLDTVRSARELAPELPLAVTTVCKAYLLVKLHELLDREIEFLDIESSSLWTLGGAPLHLFQRMGGRSCAVIPRAVDDGSMAGMQFNVGLYDRDGFIRSGRENGTDGFVIQLTHVAGNEHNVDYLRRGLWDPDLTVTGFYEDYSRAVFGKDAAGDVAKAFRILDRNEAEMGGRGAGNMPWNQQPGEIRSLRALREFDRKFYACPFDDGVLDAQRRKVEQYAAALSNLRAAGETLERAVTRCRPGGAELLRYLVERNAGYVSHLEALVTLSDAFLAYGKAFAGAGRPDAVREGMAAVVSKADEAHEHARSSAERFAACVRHTSDLGVLWSVNIAMVKGTRLFAGYVASILAFYEGRDYWLDLEWDTVFGAPVFPTYEMDRPPEQAPQGYEPG